VILAIAKLIAAQVCCDGEHPRREAALQVVAAQIDIGSDKRVMADIFGICAVTHESKAQAKHGILVTANDFTPSSCITL
jgi:hypothetical protein